MLERAGVSLVGEHVRHIAVGRVATAEISAVGFQREDIDINILSPSKVPVLYRWVSLLGARPGPALTGGQAPITGWGREVSQLSSHHSLPLQVHHRQAVTEICLRFKTWENWLKNSIVRNFSPENMMNVLH